MDCFACRQKQEERHAAVGSKLMMASTFVGAGAFAYLEALYADKQQFRNTDSLAHHFCITGLVTGSAAGWLCGWAGAALYKSVDAACTSLFSRKCTCPPGQPSRRDQPSQGTSQLHAPQVFGNNHRDDGLRDHAGGSSSGSHDSQYQTPLNNAGIEGSTSAPDDCPNQTPLDDAIASGGTSVSYGSQNQTPQSNGTVNFIINKEKFRRGFFKASRGRDSD